MDGSAGCTKKVAKPGQIEVQTGNFSLFPRYSNKGVITGWQGTAEMVVQGRDIPGIAKLTGRINTLTIAGVASNLSREQGEKVESEVAGQAIAQYRTKAADYTKQFGFTGFTVREIHINTNEPMQGAPMMRMSAKSADAAESLPVELGKGTVTVTVNGTVQMK